MASVLSTLYDAIAAVLEGDPGIKKSPHMLNPKVTPTTGVNKMYSLDIQTRNPGTMRDRAHMRLDHTVTITVVNAVRPNDVPSSQKEALDTEAAILAGMMVQEDLAIYSTIYTGTRRTLQPPGEYLYTEMAFTVSQTISITS